MDVFELSYLVRYLLVILIVLFVWLLISHSISELRWNMKYSVLPSRGFFLMASDPTTSTSESMSLPLHHTTCIGTSSSCDIRMKSRLIAKRHAIIYFFDGDWFVRAVSVKTPVYVNGVEIQHTIPLENKDIIGIGETSVVFINERETADEAQLNYEDYSNIPLYPTDKSKPRLLGAFLSVNLFTIISAALLLKFIPADQTKALKIVSIAFLVFWGLSNLYYLVLPLILKNIDKVLLLILTQLSVLGMLFQVRLELVANTASDKSPDELIGNLNSQGLSLLFAYILLPIIVVLVARTHLLERIGILCAVITPMLLIATLILGNGMDSHGATLWIKIGGMSIQLTEFAKITYLIVLASFFKTRTSRRNQLVFAGWAALVFLLIMLLPDLGSAMILLPTTLLVYVVMTSEYVTTFLILLSGSVMGTLAFAIFPHVQRRLLGWSTLWTEVNDNNRQIVYGLQAIARGGLFGRGLGNGSPGGIPLANSDMIFSIVCEELGLLTGLCIVILFIVVWLRAAKITVASHDGYSSSLAFGIGTLAFFEAAIVISGTTGLLPLTGATLPLIARGGSSVLTIVILFSILIGLSARREKGGNQL